jgi:hypothetical protein
MPQQHSSRQCRAISAALCLIDDSLAIKRLISVMAEVFFGVAWAAGVVEGGSILLHASKQQNDETRGGAMLLVPSILYGTTALPLGAIGASPGPSIVSSFPFAPSINALENDGLTETAPVTNNTANDTTNDTKLSATKQESEPSVSSEGEREPEHTIISRSEMIRKVREDNRRSLAAARQQQQHKPSFRSSSPQLIKVKRSHPPKSASTTKLLSTLDGRPLTTPLAEAMRRMRFLCVGAGLVLTMMTYQTSVQQQSEQEEALKREQRLRGRDVGAIESLLQNSNNEHGVVVRLVGENDSLQGLTRAESNKGAVLPLVHQVDSNVNVHETLLSVNNDSAYWNLGTTPQDWKETPLTKDWLLRSSSRNSENDNHARLVLEADVSPSSLYEYLQDANRHVRSEPNSTQDIDNTMMVSRILCMVAKEKGVLSDNQGDEATVNVLVGAGPRPRWLDDSNTVYIDGSKAVGNEVSSILDRIYPTDSDARTPLPQAESDAEKDATGSETESASTPPSDMTEEIPESMSDAFSLFEYVGMKLREGGTRVASAVSRVFTRGETKTVHVLSDSPVAALWLQGAMPYGWTILGYNCFEDIGLYQDVVAESGDGVTLVCCENDEATSAMVCSLLLTNGKTGASGRRLVALVQDEEYTRGLSNLATELNNETIIEIVSVKEVHSNLFGRVRELLVSGKSASEIQDSMELE